MHWKEDGITEGLEIPCCKELWILLDAVTKKHSIQWEWIKGHSGHPQNERADELANLVIEKEGAF